MGVPPSPIHMTGSSIEIAASMKAEKGLSPPPPLWEREEGICFLAPKMRWEERRKEKGKGMDTTAAQQRQIQPTKKRGMYIKCIE